MDKTRNGKFFVQYGCSMCGTIFLSEKICEIHISKCKAKCSKKTTRTEDPLEYTSKDRALKHELDPIEDSTSQNTSDNEHKSKKTKGSDTNLGKERNYVLLEEGGYEATSQMLSENEMLITLPYDKINDSTGGPLDFSNEVAIGFEQHTQDIYHFEQEQRNHAHHKNEDESTIIIENYDVDDFNEVDRNSTMKILSAFATKPLRQNRIVKDMEARQVTSDTDDDVENSETVNNKNNKVLTILNPVDINKLRSNIKEATGALEPPLRRGGEGGFEIEREVQKEHEERGASLKQRLVEVEMDSNEDTAASPNSQKQSSKSQPNKTRNYTVIFHKTQKKKALIKTGPNKGKTRRKPRRSKISATYINQNVIKEPNEKYRNSLEKQKSTFSKGTSKGLDHVSYTKIDIVEGEKRDPLEQPNKMSVYEFYDEEEEKLKAKLQEDMEKEKAVKNRTCSVCSEVFKDPIDVLRHKRQCHKLERILLSKEEIEPHMSKKKQTKCPICFKYLGKKVYQSMYEKHIMTHCDEYGFECRVCHMQFRRKDHWFNHETRHVVRPKDE